MKTEINGVRRELKIMPAPSKCFCIFEEFCYPIYPLFIGICEAITKEEIACGNILICPIFSYNGGYENAYPGEVKNGVCSSDIVTLYKNHRIYYECNESEEEMLSDIIENFEQHDFKISDRVIEEARKEIEAFENGRTK